MRIFPEGGFSNTLVYDDQQILLQYRIPDKPQIPYPYHLNFWGGAWEAGESPYDAAVRELGEELPAIKDTNALTFEGIYVMPFTPGHNFERRGCSHWLSWVYSLAVDDLATAAASCQEGEPRLYEHGSPLDKPVVSTYDAVVAQVLYGACSSMHFARSRSELVQDLLDKNILVPSFLEKSVLRHWTSELIQ